MLATETSHYSVTTEKGTFEGDRKIHWFSFDSWYDYIEAAENGETDCRYRASLEPNRRGWHGASVKDTWKLAKTGWKEGTDLLKQQIKSFENIMPSRRVRRETVMDITDPGVLDFGRWATGHPEAWMVQKESEVADSHNGNIIRMVYNISASSGVSTGEMMRKGATVVGLIDLLEQAGKRVELDLVSGTRGSGHSIRTVLRVKESSAPVDIERLAFALANPASFRRVCFSLWEQAPFEARGACGIPSGGYGMPEDFAALVDDKAVYIGTSSLERSMSEAVRVAWVTEQLAAQGVVFED